jgi:[acyl-carrier-protein] S-malonyltransferase
MNDKKLAFLFPGQGSQYVGMGRDFYDNFAIARQTFEEADEALGFSLSRLCFAGPEEQLRLTENTQPAIFTVSIAAQRVLAGKGIVPSYVAGHSLGEYAANVAAGSLGFTDALRTVRERGRYMQEAVPAGEGAMAAILNLAEDQVLSVCEEAAAETGGIVAAANINTPSQIVISGSAAAVERAMVLAKERGARKAVALAVSAPFHCPLMQPAQDRLAELLTTLSFQGASVPVLVNVDAQFVGAPAGLRDALIRQVTGTVRWVESMHLMIAEKPDFFIEAGPGKVLSGLLRQIDREQKHAHVEDSATLEAAMAIFRSSILRGQPEVVTSSVPDALRG